MDIKHIACRINIPYFWSSLVCGIHFNVIDYGESKSAFNIVLPITLAWSIFIQSLGFFGNLLPFLPFLNLEYRPLEMM